MTRKLDIDDLPPQVAAVLRSLLEAQAALEWLFDREDFGEEVSTGEILLYVAASELRDLCVQGHYFDGEALAAQYAESRRQGKAEADAMIDAMAAARAAIGRVRKAGAA